MLIIYFISPIILAAIFANNANAIDDEGFDAFGSNEDDGEYSQINELAGNFQFEINATNFKTNDCLYSPVIPLNNLNWTLRLCTVIQDINATLIASSDINSNWACEVDATINLFGNRAHQFQTYLNFTGVKFSNNQNSHEAKLINANFFENNMVEKGMAMFEIEISTTPLDTRPPASKPQLIQTYGKLHVKLHNLTHFEKTFSPIKTVQGVKWRVHIVKTNNSNLNVSLMADPNDFDVNSIYKVFGVFKLISAVRNRCNIEKTFTREFNRYNSQPVTEVLLNLNFKDMSEFYVKHDSANIVVEFKIHKSEHPFDSDLKYELGQRHKHTNQK